MLMGLSSDEVGSGESMTTSIGFEAGMVETVVAATIAVRKRRSIIVPA